MERVGGGPRKLRPPELLAEAIASPADGRIKGRPIALVDVLSRGRSHGERGAVVAYWRLAIAQGQYHYALAARDRLRRWAETRHKVTTLAESQLASAEAAVDDAEFNVLKAAEELTAAAPVLSEDGNTVPWALDRPHVGAYDMKYEQLFAGKAVPGRLLLIHRTLPISRRAIDVHGEAVVAAIDALDAIEEEYRQGAVDYQTVAGWLDRLTAQRRAFLQSVLRYNEDIAEYAFSVAPPQADARLLASILIRQPAKSTLAATLPDRAAGNAGGGAPKGSPPAERDTAPPTFRDDEPPGEQPVLDDSGWHDPGLRRPDPVGPALARPRFLFVQLPAAGNRGGQGSRSRHGTRCRPRACGHATAGGQPVARRFVPGIAQCQGGRARSKAGGIAALGPRAAGRIGRKGAARHGAVASCAGAERRAVIAAYWRTRERIARFLVLSERSESLTALAPHVLALRAQPGGTAAMLQLQAARQAAQAAVLDAQVGLLAAEFDLTRLAKSPVERAWIRPATAPYSGAFDVAANATRGADLFAAAGAATRVVTLHLELQNQALAVVFADEYRAEMTGASEHQPGTVDRTLAAIDRQLHETDRFLYALTQYNLAIADFAFVNLPPGVPAEQLMGFLVPSPRHSAGG